MQTLYVRTQVSRGTDRSSYDTYACSISGATQVVTVSCGDINTLVDRAKVYPDLSDKDRQEVIDLYYEFGETQGLYCRDAND